MNVYIDIIFLENLFMNYIILFATNIITKTKIRLLKLSISSMLGSVYAIMSYISILKVCSNIILKIMLSVAMVYIAFNPKTMKSFLKYLIIFYLISFTFGGVAFSLIYIVRPQDILLKQGVLIGTYPIKMVLIGGIIGFIISITAFKNIKGKLTKKDMICQIKIKIDNKEKEIKGIIDTGNFLKEPISQAPVIVIEKNELYEIIPSNILNNLNKIINGEAINLEEYISKVTLIPFSSLGKENGMLLGVRPDETIIYFEEHNITVKNLIIGIYDGTLNKAHKYHALAGIELLENNGGIENEHFRTIKV